MYSVYSVNNKCYSLQGLKFNHISEDEKNVSKRNFVLFYFVNILYHQKDFLNIHKNCLYICNKNYRKNCLINLL